jgi:ribokinase
VLDLVTEDQSLAWGVKGDPDAYSAGVVHKMLSKASIVSFSSRERIFIDRMIAPRSLADRTKPNALIAETHGAAGVRVWQDDFACQVPCTPIDAVDTTGAGDMFFAAAVASVIEQPGDPRRAAEHGVAAATALLLERQPVRRRSEPVP